MVATNPFALGFENSCYVWYPTQVISGFFLDPEDDTMSPAKATRISCRAERPWITLKMPSKSWDCLVARYHLDNFLGVCCQVPIGPFLSVYFEGMSVREASNAWKNGPPKRPPAALRPMSVPQKQGRESDQIGGEID